MKQILKSPIKIAVSSCLLGEAVRYDGTAKQSSLITTKLSRQFNLLSLCPEVAIGLGVPRAAIKIIEGTGYPDNFSLVDESQLTLNYTNKMLSYANQQSESLKSICGYIVKERSPSCGLRETPRFSLDGDIVSRGSGLFTHYIKQKISWLPIINESDLENDSILDNFLERVYILQSWNCDTQSCIDFSEVIKDQIKLRGKDIKKLGYKDINDIMTILTIPITMDMQVIFLVSQLEHYDIVSEQMMTAINNFKNGKLTLWNIIKQFQILFEYKKINLESNYFFPNIHEIINRAYYFGK
jgi:uncharacterized protein YbbK (DUF523 family)